MGWRQRERCQHCARRRNIQARGLCSTCYHRPDICAGYQTRRHIRNWTTREVAQLRAWRMLPQPVPFVECARRLGRSTRSVVACATRQKILTRVYYPHGVIQRTIRKLVKRGWRDADIAHAIGRSKNAVRWHRRAMGLPANRARRCTSNGQTHPDCYACGAYCPKSNHIESIGWVSRKDKACNLAETYCPKCFAEHGWPALSPITPTE